MLDECYNGRSLSGRSKPPRRIATLLGEALGGVKDHQDLLRCRWQLAYMRCLQGKDSPYQVTDLLQGFFIAFGITRS